jgi:carboxypeptidase C (cathepsin A)
MKYLFNLMKIIIVVLLVFLAQSSITNTSDFFATETGSRLLGQSYAGYEDVDWYFPKGSASIYYSLWQGFNKDWTDKSAPLIIWLQGGPGGSSQFGCFN